MLIASCALALGAFPAAGANAAVRHNYLQELSSTLTKGVPFGAAPIAGPLNAVGSLTVDSGHLWIAELDQATPRTDEFSASTGAFIAPQVNEEGGVSPTEGVAVGHAGGAEEIYLGAKTSGTTEAVIAEFDGAERKLHSVWTGANTAAKSFGVLTGLAIDGSSNPLTSGDIYVAGTGSPASSVVNVFAPKAGGGEPATTVGEITGTCPSPGESCGVTVPFAGPSGVAVSSSDGEVFVTDNMATVDVFKPTLLGQYEFVRTLTGTPTGSGGSELPFSRVVSVAAGGPNGDVYIVDQIAGTVNEFTSTGEFVGALTGTPAGPFHSVRSVAVDPASGTVFVGDVDEIQASGRVDAFSAAVTVPGVTTGSSSVRVDAQGAVEATLTGTVDPAGAGPASCAFAWGPTEALGQPPAPCDQGVVSAPTPVTAALHQLEPDTTYFYRLQASNAAGANAGEGFQTQQFLTPGPGLRDAFAVEIASTSATLGGRIEPHGAPTSFYFQYGRDAGYGSQVPAAPVAIGSGEAEVQLPSEHLQHLQPNAAYHYRLVAVSDVEVEGVTKAVSFYGADHTFETQSEKVAFALPDGRSWEQVSPVDKHGAKLRGIGETGITQASLSGAGFTYPTAVPTEEVVQGDDGTIQVLSARAADGWHSQDLAPPHHAVVGTAVGKGGDYRFFATDFSQAVLEPFGEFTSLAPEVFPPDSERGPYLRHNATCAASPATCYQPLLTKAPGYANIPSEADLEGDPKVGFLGAATMVYATPDLAHTIVESTVALTRPPGSPGLYERSAGAPPSEQVQPVSILPGGEAAENASLGRESASVRHAASDDGARVVFSTRDGHLYSRDMSARRTVQLDVPEGNCSVCGSGQPGAAFEIASSDGLRIFFTDSQKLTESAGASPGSPDLYECQIVEEKCKISDLTPASESSPSAAVQGAVLGASEDGSFVYFVANGVLGDGATQGATSGNCSGREGTGHCNLYVREGITVRFIAELSGADFPTWAGGNASSLGLLTARVSPDGRWLTFMSDRALTGFDTRDAASEMPNEEVYLYHAGESARLICASCNPSGARPTGVEYANLNGGLVGQSKVWSQESQWLAANVPGWTSYQPAHAMYQSRYLSDSGRLFFNSSDALVPWDSNHAEDVYEFEPVGVGDCSEATRSASRVFAAAAGGCVGLVSSGRAAGESAFLDASENGNDVFFLTNARLASTDTDSALDVYDAHICEPGAPCPVSSSTPPVCSTADSCRAAPTPQPPIFGAPGSAEFSGPGAASPVPSTRPHVLSRQQQLAKALALCHRQRRGSKAVRRRCERQARKHFGATHKHKANTKKGKG